MEVALDGRVIGRPRSPERGFFQRQQACGVGAGQARPRTIVGEADHHLMSRLRRHCEHRVRGQPAGQRSRKRMVGANERTFRSARTHVKPCSCGKSLRCSPASSNTATTASTDSIGTTTSTSRVGVIATDATSASAASSAAAPTITTSSRTLVSTSAASASSGVGVRIFTTSRRCRRPPPRPQAPAPPRKHSRARVGRDPRWANHRLEARDPASMDRASLRHGPLLDHAVQARAVSRSQVRSISPLSSRGARQRVRPHDGPSPHPPSLR